MLPFPHFLANAAGSLGFAPNPRGPVDLTGLGAFFTNPISLAPRSPAENRCLIPYPGGFLLHTGYPNPGLRAVIRQHADRWARSSLGVVVHLLAQTDVEAARMVERVEGLEGVIGIELGLPPQASAGDCVALIRAALGELPVVVNLAPDRVEEIGPLLKNVEIAGISLSPPRGALPGPDVRLVHGRLYGPGTFPMALSAVAAAVRLGLAVIGSGGVYSPREIAAMQHAGALAVQVDAVLWRGNRDQ